MALPLMAEDPGELPDRWVPFEDLIDDGDLPTFGFRVLVRIGDDGGMHLDHAFTGERVPGYMMIGAVMGAMLERFHDHLHEHGDE